MAAQPPDADLGARLGALESLVRAVDARLELIERATRSSTEQVRADLDGGFQEVASRALVLAEASDEIVTRVEAAVGELQVRVDDIATAVIALQPTIDAILDLQAHVDLVAERIATLLGGPSLTEIMDRIDELDDSRKR